MLSHLRIAAMFLLTASLAVSTTTAGEQPSVDVAAIVNSVGQQAIVKDQVVGLSIGVSQGGKVLNVRGFGLANVELGVPVSADTVFRIGSITKQFTAAAILLLVEDKQIALDDPLIKYLPKYPAAGRKITIRHLLQHTSGLKDFTRLPAYRAEQATRVTPGDVLDRFQHLPLEFEPGTKHRYCNSGYFVLSLVIEEVSGLTYREFIREHLLAPTGLKRTYCDTHARIIPQRATGYTRWNGNLRNAPYLNLRQTIGAGNMAATVGDLLLWQQALVEHRGLTAKSYQLMTTPGQTSDDKPFGYGLGLVIRKFNGHKVIRHGGAINGFRGDLAYYPHSGYTIAVLANSENAQAERIVDQVARRLMPTTE